MWFEYECAKAYYRKWEYRLALKQIGWMEKHLDQMTEDCIEFNNYGLRKAMLNHYMQMVDLQ